MNNICIVGKLTRDPESKQAGNAVVCRFTVAVNRYTRPGEEQKADFFDCQAWEKKGEFVQRNFGKGSGISVVGRMESRKWEKDGVKHTSWEINVSDAGFAGGKKQESNDDAPPANSWADKMGEDDTSLPFDL